MNDTLEVQVSNKPNTYAGIQDPSKERGLTFGEKLVGLKFNPSNDDKVGQTKKLFAQAADLVYDNWCRDAYSEKSTLENQLYNHTIGEILNAQMNCVKLLTLKY